MQSFRVSFLLRSFFSGVFFVLSYCNTATPDWINKEDIISLGLPSALIAGVFVYGIHRSLLYPFMEWFFNSQRAVEIRKGKWTLISDGTMGHISNRWADNDPAKQVERRREFFNVWADYIHLQYTSAWCLLFGSISGAVVSGGDCTWNCPLIILFFIFFIAANVSNWRSHSAEQFKL